MADTHITSGHLSCEYQPSLLCHNLLGKNLKVFSRIQPIRRWGMTQ